MDLKDFDKLVKFKEKETAILKQFQKLMNDPATQTFIDWGSGKAAPSFFQAQAYRRAKNLNLPTREPPNDKILFGQMLMDILTGKEPLNGRVQ